MDKFTKILVGLGTLALVAVFAMQVSLKSSVGGGEGNGIFGGSSTNSSFTVRQNFTVEGDTTLGDSSSDAITFTGTLSANSPFTSSATTTLSGPIVGPVHVSISQVATTSAANPAAAGYILNSGNPKLCLAPEIYLSTANGLFGSNWAVGTTTAAGDASLLATTTATLIASHAITSSTVGIIGGAIANNGSFYIADDNVAIPWIWKTGEYLVVSSDHSGATSSSSYISSGGFTTPRGVLTAWCYDAY